MPMGASTRNLASKDVDAFSLAAASGPQNVLLAIDTPVVDSEGCPVFEVGTADHRPSIRVGNAQTSRFGHPHGGLPWHLRPFGHRRFGHPLRR